MKKIIGRILVFALMLGLTLGLANSALAANSTLNKKYSGTFSGNQTVKLKFTLAQDAEVKIVIQNTSDWRTQKGSTQRDYTFWCYASGLKDEFGNSCYLEYDDVYIDSGLVHIGESVTIQAKLKKGTYTYEFGVDYINKYIKSYSAKITASYTQSISPTSIDMTMGQTKTCEVKFADDLTKTWSSSNKKVATVTSSGKIKVVALGNATITCKLSNGKKLKTKVYVYGFNYTKLTLAVGYTAKLKVQNLQGFEPVWQNSKKKVASISAAGTIKALKVGKTTITAYITDDLPMKATVTVIAEPELSTTKATLKKGETLTLELIGVGTKSVTWSSSAKKVATVSATGVVTAKAKGTAVITAKIDGKKYTAKITVK
ncbi:MAG: Ig-like domain-containing protein [Clostridia bacterium]|nr:Ig-like domain-containing protein [Clostridia bacterium]